MPLLANIGDTFRALRVHMFGKGLLSIAVLAVAGIATAMGVGLFWPALVTAVGGTVLTAVNRFYREGLYQDQMVNLYRDDIAGQFGIAPDAVTRDHLKQAAKSNEVIDQALKRQRQKTWVAIGTAAVAGGVTVALLSQFATTSMLQATVTQLPLIGEAIAPFANFVGIGLVSGISSLIFKGGAQTVLDTTMGLNKAAAHDRIAYMEYELGRGKPVTKEQVYSVMVAGDPKLAHAINHQFKKPYDAMNWREQSNVLHTIGCTTDMQQLAEQINHGAVRPGHLAYMLHEVTAGDAAPRDGAPQEASAVQPMRGGFVDRLNLAPKAQDSYRAQVEASRQQAALEMER